MRKESMIIANSENIKKCLKIHGCSQTELANALLDRLSRNKDIILSRADKVKATIQKFGSSLQADFTTEMLERCNLGCAPASDIRPSIEKYFNAVLAFDAQFIGGKLPDDGFYYGLN